MFARRYYAGRYYAPRYWPQSQGGSPEPEVVTQATGGGRVYPYPRDKKKKRKVIPQPLPEYEVSGPLKRQTEIEHRMLPEWDQEAWEASLKTLEYLEAERVVKVRKATESALLLWMLH